jgi:hypothetical protein
MSIRSEVEQLRQNLARVAPPDQGEPTLRIYLPSNGRDDKPGQTFRSGPDELVIYYADAPTRPWDKPPAA